MRVLFNNVDFSSRSGPNGFGQKLARELVSLEHELVSENPDVAISFIQGYVPGTRNILRLDGIYFNSEQDWQTMNMPIKQSYDLADAVIVQSQFNKDLVFKYFGDRDNVHIIHNGTCLDIIANIPAAKFDVDIAKNDVWLCAASWRPHKRLSENIRYFQKYASDSAVLLIAGSDSSLQLNEQDTRIKCVGDLSWPALISLMKASGHFLHFALLDHCPNVVIDARACGCKIICASAGGTQEVAGNTATVVKDIEWDFLPFELYNPPRLDFDQIVPTALDSDIDIKSVCKKYISIFRNEALS